MVFKKYRIEQGDTLEAISKKQNIDVKELVDFHNSHNTITQSIIGDYLPIHLEYIYLPLESPIKEENKYAEDPKEFGRKVRYRCEQVNTSKINGNLAHFLQQNFQYVVKNNGKKNEFFVGLEDHHFDFNPTYLNPSFSFISKTEFIKNQVYFQISEENGKLSEVNNKKEISENWEEFKKNEFYNDDFIIQLRKTNEHAVRELLNMGDRQFSVDYELTEEEYRRNLFYFI
ncbi:LysM peptidoglycan-binding domain-containing protein [Chryseobacterium sp. 18068]|uniref:LysM peptidoglycan-binding domain-containing protein n=1 Tax=Chryseobacterium sp. 18068 TaxID=2681414 RepID=UPI001357971A|nr:LysM peptidoglycan-binding domain-containing protein [Chryseobacterium sp. 18068]